MNDIENSYAQDLTVAFDNKQEQESHQQVNIQQDNQQQEQFAFPSDDDNKFTIPDTGIQQPLGRQQNKPKFGGGFNTQSEKKVYAVYLNYEIPGLDTLLEVQESIPSQFTVIDTISYTIDSFNQKLKQMNLNYELQSNQQCWQLFISKKNGKPKLDYPALDQDSLLSECNRIKFSLSPKENEDISKCIIDKSQNTSQVTKATERESIISQQSSQSQLNQRPTSQMQELKDGYRNSLVGKKEENKKRQEKQDKSGGCMSCF